MHPGIRIFFAPDFFSADFFSALFFLGVRHPGRDQEVCLFDVYVKEVLKVHNQLARDNV